MNAHTHLSGPDFLQGVAEAELHNGNEINFDEFTRRSKQWRELEAHAEELEAAYQQLQARLDQFTRLAEAA